MNELKKKVLLKLNWVRTMEAKDRKNTVVQKMELRNRNGFIEKFD